MPNLTYGECIVLIEAGHKFAAKEKGRPVSIAVVDDHGDLMAFGRMEGAPIRTCANAMNKAFTAIYMGRDTHDFNKMLSETGMQAEWYGDKRVTGLLGGMLIKHRDTVVGAVGVSGLLPNEDIEVAKHIVNR